jgi:hypothetical protein
MGLTIRGSNVGGIDIFSDSQDGCWDQPSILYHKYRISSPGVKRSDRRVDHLLSSSADVKETVGYTCTPYLGFHGLFKGEIYPCVSPLSSKAPSGPEPPHCRGFTITLIHTTIGIIPLDG